MWVYFYYKRETFMLSNGILFRCVCLVISLFIIFMVLLILVVYVALVIMVICKLCILFLASVVRHKRNLFLKANIKFFKVNTCVLSLRLVTTRCFFFLPKIGWLTLTLRHWCGSIIQWFIFAWKVEKFVTRPFFPIP